jgi:hypothetical protein
MSLLSNAHDDVRNIAKKIYIYIKNEIEKHIIKNNI